MSEPRKVICGHENGEDLACDLPWELYTCDDCGADLFPEPIKIGEAKDENAE